MRYRNIRCANDDYCGASGVALNVARGKRPTVTGALTDACPYGDNSDHRILPEDARSYKRSLTGARQGANDRHVWHSHLHAFLATSHANLS